MKIFILLLSLIPLYSTISFTLQGNQEFCLYFNNPQNESMGYALFYAEDYNDKLLEFKAFSPIGEEIIQDYGKPYDFNVAGEYQFCAKNKEYHSKNASILINNFNMSHHADVGYANTMEQFANQIYENLNIVEEGVKMRDVRSIIQNNISEWNSQKLNSCSIAKIVVLGIIMLAQVFVLKAFINRKK